MENRYKNGFQTQEPSWSWFFFVRENHVITGWCPPFCYVNVGLDELPMNTIVRYIYHKPELNHLYIYISTEGYLGGPSCRAYSLRRTGWGAYDPLAYPRDPFGQHFSHMSSLQNRKPRFT